MDMIAWILICLFASIGIVQCCAWLFGAWKSPGIPWRGFYVLPVHGDCETLESEIRQAMARIRWNGSGCEPVFLVDSELDEESRTICRALLAELGGSVVCSQEELANELELLARKN